MPGCSILSLLQICVSLYHDQNRAVNPHLTALPAAMQHMAPALTMLPPEIFMLIVDQLCPAVDLSSVKTPWIWRVFASPPGGCGSCAMLRCGDWICGAAVPRRCRLFCGDSQVCISLKSGTKPFKSLQHSTGQGAWWRRGNPDGSAAHATASQR